MEDEFISVDNLGDHLGEALDLVSPGAFYGVCKFSVRFTFLFKK